jgi:hypothetical protein
LRARVPDSPFQTVLASFPHTAYRWSSRAACGQHADEDANHPPQGRRPWGLFRVDDGTDRRCGLGDHGQLLPRFSGFFKGVVGPTGHALTLTPVPERDQSRAPSLRRRSGRRHPRYYEPLGLPPGTVTLRHRHIATAFARRGPPGRVSPVPHQAFATCPLPYPEGVLWVSGHCRSTVYCLRRNMIGSATLPFGTYLTRLQRFTHVGPAALLPLHEAYAPLTAFDAPLRRRHFWRRPEPATRRTRRAYRGGTLTRWSGAASGPHPGSPFRTRHDVESTPQSARQSRVIEDPGCTRLARVPVMIPVGPSWPLDRIRWPLGESG